MLFLGAQYTFQHTLRGGVGIAYKSDGFGIGLDRNAFGDRIMGVLGVVTSCVTQCCILTQRLRRPSNAPTSNAAAEVMATAGHGFFLMYRPLAAAASLAVPVTESIDLPATVAR